jgi:hypothetical protein
VVSVSLKVELPLKASSSEELLILANDLQEKVKAADLGRTKDLKQLSAQEEELAEESGEGGNPYEDGQPKPGEPVFLFVSKISEQEQAKALAEAYQKAKREAERLARAAEAELGPLLYLDNTPIGADFADEAMMDYSGRYAYQMRQRFGQLAGDEQAREAVGFQPGKAVYRVSVTASFGIKTLKPMPTK